MTKKKDVNGNISPDIQIKLEKDSDAEETIVYQSLLPAATFDTEFMIKHEPEVEYEIVKEMIDIEDDKEKIVKVEKAKKKAFTCKICSKGFDTKIGLSSHQWLHRDAKFSCSDCGMKFKKLYAFKNHKCIVCPHCNKLFFERRLLKSHLLIHADDAQRNIFTCDLCGKNLKHRTSIERHVIEHINIASIECKLDGCGKMWKTETGLREHQKNAHQGGLAKCKECGKEMKPASLYGHMKHVHAVEEADHLCNVCNSTFKSLARLKEHRKSHFKKFQCEICQRKFAEGYDYNQHKKYHADPKAFTCKICNKSFKAPTNLRTHMKLHDGSMQRNLQCDNCIFTTHRKESLIYHVKAHIKRNEKFKGIKNAVRCKLCGLFMRNKWALKSHILSVHPEKKFKCDRCGIQTKTKISMKEHLQSKHLKIPEILNRRKSKNFRLNVKVNNIIKLG